MLHILVLVLVLTVAGQVSGSEYGHRMYACKSYDSYRSIGDNQENQQAVTLSEVK